MILISIIIKGCHQFSFTQCRIPVIPFVEKKSLMSRKRGFRQYFHGSNYHATRVLTSVVLSRSFATVDLTSWNNLPTSIP